MVPRCYPSPALPSNSRLLGAGSIHQRVRRPPVFLEKQSRHRRLAGVVQAAPDAPPVVRAAVGAVTELLRALSPNKKPRDAKQGGNVDPPPCGSVEDVLAVLEDDYRRAYFLTGMGFLDLAAFFHRSSPGTLQSVPWRLSDCRGDFTPSIYTEDCLFEDPTIKFRGRSRYSQNLDLLVPFFDTPSLELESIEKGSGVETNFIKATWKLRTYLRLPWRPLIAIRGNTTYDLNEDYKVTRHSESWDVSALEAISQIFVSAPEQQKGS